MLRSEQPQVGPGVHRQTNAEQRRRSLVRVEGRIHGGAHLQTEGEQALQRQPLAGQGLWHGKFPVSRLGDELKHYRIRREQAHQERGKGHRGCQEHEQGRRGHVVAVAKEERSEQGSKPHDLHGKHQEPGE